MYGCLDNCVYEDQNGNHVCFKRGDFEAQCVNPSNLSGSCDSAIKKIYDVVVQNGEKLNGLQQAESNPGFSPSLQVFEFEGCCKHLAIGDRTFLNIPSETSTGCEDSCYYQQVGDFNNRHCLVPGDQTTCLSHEETCVNEAISLGMTDCKGACDDESSPACSKCMENNLGRCGGPEILIPWKCFLPGPLLCGSKCTYDNAPHFLDVAKCTISCLKDQYSSCVEFACEILGKVNSQAGAICGCTVSIPPTIVSCKAKKLDVLHTVLCVFNGIFLSPCTEVVCNLLADAIENPELAPLCNCGVGILKNLDKCYQTYGKDWKKVAACVVAGSLLDCKQYVCKFISQVVPEIEEFCPTSSKLEQSFNSTKVVWAKGWGGK